MINKALFLSLTKRELELVEKVVILGNIKGAAKFLHISPRTAETHIEHIKEKLGIQYKYQLNQIFLENFYQRIN